VSLSSNVIQKRTIWLLLYNQALLNRSPQQEQEEQEQWMSSDMRSVSELKRLGKRYIRLHVFSRLYPHVLSAFSLGLSHSLLIYFH